MAQMTLIQDLDLCRKILLRTEEVWRETAPRAPPTTDSMGTSVTGLCYNIEALHHEGSLKQGSRPKGQGNGRADP